MKGFCAFVSSCETNEYFDQKECFISTYCGFAQCLEGAVSFLLSVKMMPLNDRNVGV